MVGEEAEGASDAAEIEVVVLDGWDLCGDGCGVDRDVDLGVLVAYPCSRPAGCHARDFRAAWVGDREVESAKAGTDLACDWSRKSLVL